MSIGHSIVNINGRAHRRLIASTFVDVVTIEAIKRGAERDRDTLPNMDSVLSYCLSLGVQAYLDGQPDE